VELLPANEDAARIFYLVRRQVVTAEQGCVVDVSIPAIRAAMEVTGVQDQAGCLTKVLRLWREVELER
jgi:hypothetical protein